MHFWISLLNRYTHLLLECSELRTYFCITWTFINHSSYFFWVLWKLKFLLSPSWSLQRESNCKTSPRKRNWITKQNSLSHLFKPYQFWMKSHTSTHCGPIFLESVPSAWICNSRFLFIQTRKIPRKGHLNDLSNEYKIISVSKRIFCKKGFLMSAMRG